MEPEVQVIKSPPKFGLRQGARVMFNIVNHCIAKTVISPYERVKLLQQLSPLIPASQGVGTIQMLKFVVQRQGFFSLWRGNIAGCLTVVPSLIIKEVVDPLIRPYIVRHDAHQNYWLYLIEELIAEGVTTTIRLLLAHPFTVLHTRMAADLGTEYTGYNSFIYSVVNVHGLFGVYRGVTLSLLVALIQKAVFILITEYFRGYTIENTNENHIIQEDEEMEVNKTKNEKPENSQSFYGFLDKQVNSWILSHICTHFSSIFTYPLDTISKGCMALDIPLSRCYRKITAVNGVALYRGLGTHFLAGTVFSMTLLGLTRLKWYYLQSRRSRKPRNYHVLHETH